MRRRAVLYNPLRTFFVYSNEGKHLDTVQYRDRTLTAGRVRAHVIKVYGYYDKIAVIEKPKSIFKNPEKYQHLLK